MAARENRFKKLYKSRNDTATDTTVEQLLAQEEEKTVEETKKAKEKKEEKPVEEPKEKVVVPEINEEKEVLKTILEESDSTETAPKKGVGRPRKYQDNPVMFNIRLSAQERDIISLCAQVKGVSKTDYIMSLVRQDYEANQDLYDKIKDVLR
ncbi:MAG: hypothetical protein K6F69_10155 [Treponema sp.]|nr:hypothetical protein [Treponema sp.]